MQPPVDLVAGDIAPHAVQGCVAQRLEERDFTINVDEVDSAMRSSDNNVPVSVQHVDVGVRSLHIDRGYILQSQTPCNRVDRDPAANMLGRQIALRPLPHLHLTGNVRQGHPACRATDRHAADILHMQIAAGLYQLHASVQVAYLHLSSRRDLHQFARLRQAHRAGRINLDLNPLLTAVHFWLTSMGVHFDQRLLPPLDAHISSTLDSYARVRRFRFHLYPVSHLAPLYLPANVANL